MELHGDKATPHNHHSTMMCLFFVGSLGKERTSLSSYLKRPSSGDSEEHPKSEQDKLSFQVFCKNSSSQ